MSIKLIATDLDGTLMSPDHLTITDFTLDTLKKAHEKGIKIAIATGRPLRLIDSVVEQIPFADYIIYANGACVFDRAENKLIYSNLIPYTVAREIIDYLLKTKVFFEIYIDGASHFQLGTEGYFDNTGFPEGFIKEVQKSMTGHKDLIKCLDGRGVEKITIYSIDEAEFATLHERLSGASLACTSSFGGNLEATVNGANKGVALAGLCEKLGITADEVMSFGDAGNDIEMLQFAKYSFAMGNADEDCKKSAKFLAKSNGEDGLALAVEEYALMEK